MNSFIKEIKKRVRTRVCGLCIHDNRVLMVNHRALTKGDFWAPPGGGIHFNESAQYALKREFMEETGITVKVKEFLFVCEVIQPMLHAIELFFRVEHQSGNVIQGYDPEMSAKDQLITDVKYLKWSQIKQINPAYLHGIFNCISEPSEVLRLKGLYKIMPNGLKLL